MPRPSRHLLIWSQEQQIYELRSQGQREQGFPPADPFAFICWLEEHTSFAFVGQYGSLSVIKESRQRGSDYWYAYRRLARHTSKRYLGRTRQMTFACLEQAAKALSREGEAPAKHMAHNKEVLIPHATMPGSPEPGANAFSASENRFAVPTSKFGAPRLPSVLVSRSRLLQDLERAVLTHPLTLVSASAGSGKTTLLSAWAASSWQQAGAGKEQPAERVVAWLSLDALDSDPIRFWSLCITALSTPCSTWYPSLGAVALTLLHAQQTPPLSSILTSLLNDLSEVGKPLILILDDYQVITDQSIGESVLFLIHHLPANLHLVLISRTDPDLPLASLRGRGQLLEIRDQHLRFRHQETRQFLVQAMGLPLSGEAVSTLHQRTEGWITGLQLAALSLQQQKDHEAWVSDFVGSHRYIQDYVQQDILAQVPLPLEHFLLHTSLLTRMNAALCQAVGAGPTVEACQHCLEEVERANLFVVPLDEHRQWYRYHDLFREALLARLMGSHPEQVPLAHQRAARYYEAAGQWHEAIAHALASPGYSLAASLMEQAAPAFWLSGQARAVHTWVLMLPDVVLRAHIHLALDATLRFLNSVTLGTKSMDASMAARVEQTIARIEEVLYRAPEQTLSDTEVTLIGQRLRLLRALIEGRSFIKRGDTERLRLLIREIENLPADSEVSWNMIPLSFTLWLTVAFQQEGAFLVPRLLEAKQQMRETGDHLATVRVMQWLALAYQQAGQLHQVHQECLEALALIEQIGGRTAMTGYLHHTLFYVYYCWNRFHEASEVLCRLIQIGQDWQQVELQVLGQIASARLGLARGDLSTAQEALQKLEALVEREGFASLAHRVVETRVQVWLAQSKLAEASAWAAQTASSLQARTTSLHKWEVLMLVRVLLAQKQFSRAVETLNRFCYQLDRKGDSETTIHFLALSLVALHHAGRSAQAAEVAVRLFTLTEAQGYLRLYLDAGPPMRETLKTLLAMALQADQRRQQDEGNQTALSKPFLLRLLTAFHQEKGHLPAADGTSLAGAVSHGPSPWPTSEPLSPQEQRVLRLLASGLSREEIAQVLVISLNTVKTHLQRIYQKLQVHNRFQACEIVYRLDS